MCRVKPQDDFCVSVQVPVGRVPRVILMGVRSDVEAAARRIREISHEFCEIEDRLPLERCQVTVDAVVPL